MKIEVVQVRNQNNNTLELIVEYSRKEWERIKSYYESLPQIYRKGYSQNIFGVGVSGEVYFVSERNREYGSDLAEGLDFVVSEEIYQKDGVRVRVVDNINNALIYMQNGVLVLNIALFRIIPKFDDTKNKYILKMTLPESFIYLPGFKFYRYLVKHYIKALPIYERNKKVKIIYRLEVSEE